MNTPPWRHDEVAVGVEVQSGGGEADPDSPGQQLDCCLRRGARRFPARVDCEDLTGVSSAGRQSGEVGEHGRGANCLRARRLVGRHQSDPVGGGPGARRPGDPNRQPLDSQRDARRCTRWLWLRRCVRAGAQGARDAAPLAATRHG